MKLLKWAGAVIVVMVIFAMLAPTQDEVMEQVQADGAEFVREIENQVAADAVAQYRMVERNGSPMDRCVQAGMVAAAFLQANDEPQYAAWKATETRECAAAGLPQQ